MDLNSLTISVPLAISIVGCVIAVATYFGNKNKQSKNDEARLVSMEKDIQYIRKSVDGIDAKLSQHDKRIGKLEAECQRRKL